MTRRSIAEPMRSIEPALAWPALLHACSAASLHPIVGALAQFNCLHDNAVGALL